MDTAAISVRVVDFLKGYPPFSAMDEADLLDLAGLGRVRFYEPTEYVLWQGEPHKAHLFVIQQGTVSLWDEAGERPQLRDIRGAGDMLGTERFSGAAACAYSARSESDVVIYALPAMELAALLAKNPRAEHYVTAEGRVSADHRAHGEGRDIHTLYLQEVVAHNVPPSCSLDDTVREAAGRMRLAGSGAVAVVDGSRRVRGVLTADDIVEWVARGPVDGGQPVGELLRSAPVVLAPDATIVEGLLALGAADSSALAITEGGRPDGVCHALVSSADMARVFGDQPVALVHEIRVAADPRALRELNRRARGFTCQHLTSPAAADWLSRFTNQVDAAIIARLVSLAGDDDLTACWCAWGAAGRAESLTALLPPLALVLEDDSALRRGRDVYARVLDALMECGYLPGQDEAADRACPVSTLADWADRFRGWIRDPIGQEMYRARSFFDMRPIHGRRELWQALGSSVMPAVDRDFIYVLANDCLTSLPPLTVFQDAVVDTFGEQTTVFHLGQDALDPLVDVGRVFAMAARTPFGTSTLERFAAARALLPEQDSVFREAADTFRIVLWVQGRIGIGQGTSGLDVPPSLLSRHDRQILKGGFRAILRLLEFTANPAWLETL